MTDSIDLEVRLDCYERMRRIRTFEERAVELFKDGELPGFIHPSVGQEAAAVGLTYFCRRDDFLTSTHRGHGHILAKGADVHGMMAELFGREGGLCRGRGGSMHIIDSDVGVLGANGIVGGGIPIATGAALAASMDDHDERVTICFFGDGAVNIGAFHEALNLAGLWQLPIVFVCENNQYAESTPLTDALPIPDLSARAASYGMPARIIDGNDIDECLTAGSLSIALARDGDGPTLVQANTYRHYGHHTGDTAPYRTAEELASWKATDPLLVLRSRLQDQDAALGDELDRVDHVITDEIEAAVRAARESPHPDPSDVMRYVFAERSDR